MKQKGKAHSFSEAVFILIPKPNGTQTKMNYKAVSLMSTDTRILNKILAN
jgi:hypothetical protein